MSTTFATMIWRPYLFQEVSPRFHIEGRLSAFDFFSIVIWKANRAKSKVAGQLLRGGSANDLDEVVGVLSRSLCKAETPRERLRILMQDWSCRLPIASAILTVLWPDDFTVYDVRVCKELGRFHQLADWNQFDKIWPRYKEFCEAVQNEGPKELSLRDKDRHFWAKSSATQLQEDIARCFANIDQHA